MLSLVLWCIASLFVYGTYSEITGRSCTRRVVGYVTSWGKVPFRDEQAKRLTHLIFAFFVMEPNGELHLDSDSSRTRLIEIMQICHRHPHLKVLFAIGGWENSQYFSLLSADHPRRSILISNIISVIQKFGFDGVDIDWEYPVTGGAVEGSPADRKNYVHLLRELRNRLRELEEEEKKKEGFLISFAGAAGHWVLKPGIVFLIFLNYEPMLLFNRIPFCSFCLVLIIYFLIKDCFGNITKIFLIGYDLLQLIKYADFINVMSYDYFGPWQSKWGAFTGPPAPLYFNMPKN
uniref:Glyco_18 domain-containing protein n=1 Tax=Heterorhabditis bacteriophora TaxID=37862 RepID=A0A1I7WRH7_HETBA